MSLIRTTARRTTVLLTAATATLLATSGVAFADNIQDSIVGSGAVTLEAGSATGGTASIRVVGNNSDGTTTDPGCNWDTGEQPLKLDVVMPAGVTATPDPLEITECGTDVNVTFKANASAVSGIATVSIVSAPAGGGAYNNQVSIPITVNAPPPPANTKPAVSVTGVVNGATYEIGAVPAAGCSVIDVEDGNGTATPVITGTLSHALGQQTVTCDATDSGGLAADTKSATYTVGDTGKPTITVASVTPAANTFGWRNTDVVVSFTCADLGGSGVQGCTADTTLSEGANQSVTGTATDWAGNTETVTVNGVNIDKTGPAITDDSATHGATGTVGANGWYTSNVTVTFRASDNLSGFAGAANPHTFTRTTSGDGEAVTVSSGTIQDLAGNTSNSVTSASFNIDTVAPSVGNAVLTGTEGNGGWYTTAVTASFTGTDATSGVAGTNPKTVSTGTDQGEITLSSPAFSDVAGNTTAAGATSATVNVDSVAPSVALSNGPANASSYYFGSVPPAPTCLATDATSGLVGACTVSGYSSSVGSHTVTATATDKAGNVATASRSYTVLAWNLSGFYSPVDMNGVWNSAKGGQTIPLKFEVFAGSTELTDVSLVTISLHKVTCPSSTVVVDAIEELVNTGGTNLRYDSVGGQFIQNWKTPTGAGCYTATMTADDGSSFSANFKMAK